MSIQPDEISQAKKGAGLSTPLEGRWQTKQEQRLRSFPSLTIFPKLLPLQDTIIKLSLIDETNDQSNGRLSPNPPTA